MERGFLSQKGSGGGRGVKEKKHGDGGAHSLGNDGALSGISNTVDDVGKVYDGLNSSPTKVTPRNLTMNKEGNLHEENDGHTPIKPIDNPNKVCGIPPLSLTMLGTLRGIMAWLNQCLTRLARYGSWFICNNPLILKKWNPNVNILKEDVGNVPVWVKLHGILVTAFSEDSLNAIATKIGTPLMLDSYTSNMCIQSWGRSSYARALIEDECPKNKVSNVVRNMKKPSQTHRGVPVGPKRLIIDGTATLVDDEHKPLTRVDSSGDHDSEDEVASVDNDMANFRASKDVGYGHDIPDKIQDICDNFDIKVRGVLKAFGPESDGVSIDYISEALHSGFLMQQVFSYDAVGILLSFIPDMDVFG
ncbi:reverse transcriptase domain-containing protein [Tanacetum coccineum]